MNKWREEAISKLHKRDAFDCGKPELNGFLLRYARQSHERDTAKTYLAIDGNNDIMGFYTLTMTSVDVSRLSPEQAKGLGLHGVPLFVLARLAVDVRFQGQGLGGQLLYAAARRCALVAEQVGGVGLLIDAKDDDAANWYRLFGAQSLPSAPLSLILPFKQIL